jgi:probable F420-dependent oxidoreductase
MATAEGAVALARRGEESGFNFAGVSDHIVIPRDIASRYPYNENGEFAIAGELTGECLEQLTLITFLAAGTSRLRLLTSVMVLPHRNPVHTAKALATIDVLSGGRLIVGCGVGWMREEFEALGTPPFERRGAVGNEYLAAFKELWTSDSPEFDGEFVSFSNIQSLPQPVQKPHPPIWIGGESPPALRRAGELGDAWYPIGNNPRYPMRTIDELTAGFERVRQNAAGSGRGKDEVGLSYSAGWYRDDRKEELPDGSRRLLTGNPDDVSGDIRKLQDAGVGHLMLGMQSDTLEGSVKRMERFASEVKPLVDR